MNSHPSDVRCPSCGRITPFAPFCTHCGAVIPGGAGAARPIGMDRSELEERIRSRRGTEDPFRRGGAVGGDAGDVWRNPVQSQRFVPEPTDELAREVRQTEAAESPRVDYFDERSSAAGVPPHSPDREAMLHGEGGIPGAALPPTASEWPSHDLEEPEPQSARQSIVPPISVPAPAPESIVPPISVPAPAQEVAEAQEEAQESEASLPDVASEPEPVSEREPAPEPQSAAPEPQGRTRTEREIPAAFGAAPIAAEPFDPAPMAAPTPVHTPLHEAWTATPDRMVEERGDEPPYGYDDGGYGEPDFGDEPPRRGSGVLPVVGFIVLGVAALLGGALFFGAMNAPGSVAQSTSTPTPTLAESATPSETATPTEGASSSAAASPSTSAVPDNFTARAQPCATSKMSFSGCDQDGSSLDTGQVWVWVGFKNGQATDDLGVKIVSKPSDTAVADGSVELTRIGCDPDKPCSGYIQMTFDNLDPGDYTIQVLRNGDQVAAADFTVNG